MTRILGISPSDFSTNRDLNFYTYTFTLHIYTLTLHLHPTSLFGHPERKLAGADSLTTYLTCFVITSLGMYLHSVMWKERKNGIEKDR